MSCAKMQVSSDARQNRSTSTPSIAGLPLTVTASDSRSASSVSSLTASAGSAQFELWQISSGCGRSHAATARIASRLVDAIRILEAHEHAEVEEVDEIAARRERDPVGRQPGAMLDDDRRELEVKARTDVTADLR